MTVEDLEYKMSNMQPAEEQLITGNAMGSYQVGGNPTVGDVLTYTITPASGSPITATYTVTSADLNPASNPVNPNEAAPTFSIALNSSKAINAAAQAAGFQAVGAMPADLFNPQYLPPFFAEVIVTGPNSNAFTLSCSVTGATNLLVENPGAVSPIEATVNNATVYGYVALLDALAMGMTQANLSLTYQKADVVDFRQDEVAARRRLYREYCIMLSRDLGGREYIDRVGGAGSLLGGGGSGAVA